MELFLDCTYNDGSVKDCNDAGTGSCSATDCDCDVIRYEGNQCENCKAGYYASSGTDGIDPTCDGM